MSLAQRLVARKKQAYAALRLVERFKGAKAPSGPMVIGPKGLQQPGGKSLTLQEGAAYWMGASTSPKMVIVTDVTDDRVKFKSYPFTGGAQTLERWIAADLFAKGSETHLKQYGAYMDPDLKRSLESLLRGGKGRKEDMDDYRPVTMTLAPADDQKGEDLWYAAEEYGGVGGQTQDDGTMYYMVDTEKRNVEKAKNDRRFKVVKVENRSSAE
jgi:hypothetical protein